MRRVVYVQFTNPAGYPPLEHSSRILASDGFDVVFLGTGSLGTQSLEFVPSPRIRTRLLKYRPPGVLQKVQYAYFCLWVSVWVLRLRPTVIYASDVMACPAAWLAATLSDARLVYHEHDAPPEAPEGRFGLLLLAARRWCARHAAVCVVPSAGRAVDFLRTTRMSRPVDVVWNTPSLDEVTPLERRTPPAGIRLLYHGSIVPDRVPQTVVNALSLLPGDVTLSLAGYETAGSQGYVERLLRLAGELGIGARVVSLGTVPTRRALLEQCARHDAGLSLVPMQGTDVNLLTMAGASNKPFDYLSAGLPVLVSNLPDWREMFVATGYGLSCDPGDPRSIADAILRWYSDPKVMRQMGALGHERITTDWNYERQFQRVRSVCNGVGRG